MTVRHLTDVSNVDSDGFVIDPAGVYHGSIEGSMIAALGGPVDPSTHFNYDFPDHEIGECVVTEGLEKGAPVVVDSEGHFVHAPVRPDARVSLGRVNQGERRVEWLQVLADRRPADDN